jgi:signal transduction histidine kinase
MGTPPRGVVFAVAGAGAGLCAAIAWVTATGTASGDVPLEATARTLMVGLPIGVGLYAWSRPASARFGRNMTLTGFVYFLAMLSSASSDVVHSVGRVAGWLVEVWLVYLVLSFPSGRLTGRADRVIIAFGVALVVVLYLPTAVMVDGYPTPSQWESCVSDCPANAFQLMDSEPAVVEAWVRPLREVLTVLLFSVVTVRLAMRMAAASPLMRRAIGPVLVVAIARVALFVVALATRAVDPEGTPAAVSTWLIALAVPGITLAFLVGIVRWRLFVGASLARLTHHTARYTSPDELRHALADAFEDPDLEILYRGSEGGWVGAGGSPATGPPAGSSRALTEVRENGRPVAAVVHDEALRDERAFVDAATALAVTTLENRRLMDRTAALLREVEDSRARIAAAADEERRRLERDLHDGAQQRLVALRMRLSVAAELLARDHVRGAELVRQLGPETEAALEEMRSLARGVYPAPLVDHGLVDALRAAARQSPLPVAVVAERGRRYAPSIEAAGYFCCLEALQNAAKHAEGATRVTVTIAEFDGHLRLEVADDGIGFDPAGAKRGSGLTNLEDRARAVGGDMIVESGPGAGTRLSVTLPRESVI